MNEDELLALIETGIHTDGAHHKQWCLMQILKLVNPEHYDYVRSFEVVDEGIEP